MKSPPSIERGQCSVFFAFDVGQSIDLDAAERLLEGTSSRERLRHRRRNPPWFQYQPPPLRVTSTVSAIEGRTFRTASSVDLVLYDFGAISLEFVMPLSGPLDGLLSLSLELEDDPRLEREARRHVGEILEVIGSALHRAHLAEQAETYFVMRVLKLGGNQRLSSIVADHGPLLAQILRAERGELSSQEVDDALSCNVAFGVDDLALVDWNGALLFDPEPDDTLSLLEFANVQLLEMRFIDNKLDDSLERAYQILSRQRERRRRPFGSGDADVQQVALLQADTAILFESVTNSLKLLGDAFLARFYEATSKRFHLTEWHESVTRKLAVLESIYGKLSDRQSTFRMEVLEWIIIVLIAVSMVLPFVVPMAK